MKLFKGLVKIALAPLGGISEVFLDISGKHSEEEQGIAILTVGASSVIKGVAKSIVSGTEDIFND